MREINVPSLSAASVDLETRGEATIVTDADISRSFQHVRLLLASPPTRMATKAMDTIFSRRSIAHPIWTHVSGRSIRTGAECAGSPRGWTTGLAIFGASRAARGISTTPREKQMMRSASRPRAFPRRRIHLGEPVGRCTHLPGGKRRASVAINVVLRRKFLCRPGGRQGFPCEKLALKPVRPIRRRPVNHYLGVLLGVHTNLRKI